ncbi:VIT family protein [Sphingobium sp. H39-3-25]|uniref:VIT1/CCC1 transporter family protein n=1 Tax=Sphingobium arseniciresistens TaxID=3030834 RepID=UPI0023B8C4E0|nr:VIT family protein [Sphingobium arseniciresistens]
MVRSSLHPERHAVSRIGWLRAAVLGANDGIVSTASLIVGVAAAQSARGDVLIAGFAALVAGAMSMAAGEYVSVSSQADAERADLATERRELEEQPDFELDELTAIYVARGLNPALARQVAEELTDHDALATHARDELGMSDHVSARPLQAAFTSALTFSTGAAVPLLSVALAPNVPIVPLVSIVALLCLALLGYLGARGGGAAPGKSVWRVIFWGVLAMALTAGIGHVFGTAV